MDSCATQPITQDALFKISSIRIFVGLTAVSIRIPGLEKKSLMINTRLLFNGSGIKVYVMVKVVRVLRNLRFVCLLNTNEFPHCGKRKNLDKHIELLQDANSAKSFRDQGLNFHKPLLKAP